MQERVLNVLVEECFAFLQYVKIIDYGSIHNIYDLCMLYYKVYRSFVAQMVELVVVVVVVFYSCIA